MHRARKPCPICGIEQKPDLDFYCEEKKIGNPATGGYRLEGIDRYSIRAWGGS